MRRDFPRWRRGLSAAALAVAAVVAGVGQGLGAVSGGAGGAGVGGAAARPIELRLAPYLGDTKTVTVGAGADALPYVFDTGGGLTVITPAVARRLGCEPFGQLTGFRASGERLDMPRCGPVRLQLGPVAVNDEAAILDLMSLIGAGAPEVGGLVSLATLREHPITIDFAHNRLILETDASLKKRIKGMRPMQVRTERQAGGATLDLFVAVKARRGTIWLELDSGNVGPVQLAPHAVEQLGLAPDALTRGEIQLDFVGLGPVSASASQEPIIYDGLLNAATISRLVLTLDLRSERMWGSLLTPAPPHAP